MERQSLKDLQDSVINSQEEFKKVEHDVIPVFDPRVTFKSKKEQDEAKIIWSSKSIELAYEAIKDGLGLKISPFMRNDTKLRKANLNFQYSEEETLEIIKCKKDILYFAEKYVYLMTPKGKQIIKLRGYQKRLLKLMQDNRWIILLQSRQSAKTTTTAIFFAWYLLFNIDKTAAIVAQREKIAAEVYSKIKDIIYHLPFFLKPGCISWVAESFAFDNGCRAIYRPASKDCLQGFTINLLFADEFAYITNKRAKEFYENVYPTLEADPNSRFIICSTPQGRNLYYEIWSRAILKLNHFIPFRVDWWEVPGRDEKWKKLTIANLNGDEGAFNQQYALSFDTGVKNSLESKTYQWLNKLESNFISGAFNMGSDWNDYFRWSTKFKYNFKKDYFLMSVDIAEGMGGDADFSTIKIRKLIKTKEHNILLPTIGVFECNTIQITDFAKVILLMMKKFTQDQVRLVIERNSFGDLLLRDLDNISEKMPDVEIELETYAKFARKEGYKLEKGLRLNSKTKRIGVAAWKEYVDSQIFIETDKPSIQQYREFGADENGNFKAGVGHDDLVMPDVNAAFYVKSNLNGWTEFIEDFHGNTQLDEFNLQQLKKLNITALQSLLSERDDYDDSIDSEYELLKDIKFEDMQINSPNEYTILDSLLKDTDNIGDENLIGFENSTDTKKIGTHNIIGSDNEYLRKQKYHQKMTLGELTNDLLDLV